MFLTLFQSLQHMCDIQSCYDARDAIASKNVLNMNIAAGKLIKFHILQSRVQRKIADVSSKTFKKFTDLFILELQN